MQNLNSQLADYLKKINLQHSSSFTQPTARKVVSALIQTICQSRNLLHYRHVDDRSTAEKCLLLIEDLFNRTISDHPNILEHITN